MVKLHGQTGTEKHHNLLLAILLEECEKQEKPFLGWAYNVA
jgi:hypothetical protein